MAPAGPGRVLGEPARSIAVRGCFVAGPVRDLRLPQQAFMQPSPLVPVTTAVIAAGRGAHELFGDGPRVRRRPVLTMAPPLVAIVALTAWP
jgi:hypothetical protein